MMKRSLKGKKVIVTGYSGYVGKYLVEELIKHEAIVFGIGRRILGLNKNIEAYSCDITDAKEVLKVINKIQPHAIFHAAAYGLSQAQTDIYKAVDININGTINLIEAVRNVENFEVFINTGSGVEYGDREITLKEDMDLRPLSGYSSTKAAATMIAHQLCLNYNIPIITLRMFCIYGGIDNTNRFIPYIIDAILSKKEANLSSCKQIRDYVFIDDIVNSYICSYNNFNRKSEIINISTNSEVTLEELVEIIKHIGNPNPIVNIGALKDRKQEIWRLVGNNDKAKEIIEWEPKVDIYNGLKETVELYRRRHV